jgi:hypothetical protein
MTGTVTHATRLQRGADTQWRILIDDPGLG